MKKLTIEFDDKIILSADEKEYLKPVIEEIVKDISENPLNIYVCIDRVIDDLSHIFRNREWQPSKTKRLKPDDKGDNENGSVNVTV